MLSSAQALKALGKRLDCKIVADKIHELTRKNIENYRLKPKISIILSEDSNGRTRMDSAIYVKKKIETLNKLGIAIDVIRINEAMPKEDVYNMIEKLNSNRNNHGIFLQLPLNGHYGFTANELIDRISIEKDIDGLSTNAIARLISNSDYSIRPATPLGICGLLSYYNIDVLGKNVCIIGKGQLVGNPLSIMLIKSPFYSTVTMCDIYTENIKEISRKSNLIVAACGQANVITPDYVSPDSIIIDVGINRTSNPQNNGPQITGDVCQTTYDYCNYYTGVPGGVGLLTVASVGFNVLSAYNLQMDRKPIDLFSELRPKSNKIYLLPPNAYVKQSIKKMDVNIENAKYKIMLISSAYNGITQILDKKLNNLGYKVSVHIAKSESTIKNAVDEFSPSLIICPMLKTKIPKEVYEKIKCLIVHPGIKGDRGSSSLDYAILNNEKEWGITILEASDVLDGGDIWATKKFEMKPGYSKTNIYGSFVADLSQKLILECIEKFKSNNFVPEPLNYSDASVKGKFNPSIKSTDSHRNINWKEDDTETVIRKILAGDTMPGVKANLLIDGNEVSRLLFGVSREKYLKPEENIVPGQVFAKKDEAICIATRDGAIWVSQLKKSKTPDYPNPIKLPATIELKRQVENIPDKSSSSYLNKFDNNTFQEISFERFDDYGVLYFDFYNGAMSTVQCNRLSKAIEQCASDKSLKAIVFAGSSKNWSNGIHLNVIEAAEEPKQEAWNNIKAINNVVKQIIKIEDKITISAIQANAGAGGFYLALASDFVFAKPTVVFNPHYKNMGLYGSELHTFTAKNRVGLKKLHLLRDNPKPLLVNEAIQLGLIDCIENELDEFKVAVKKEHFLDNVLVFAEKNVSNPEHFNEYIKTKRKLYEMINIQKCIDKHEEDELSEMSKDMFHDRNSFSIKRQKFVFKL